jgi:RNA polymerase sigma-70 factor (ECF subfamily)
MRVARNLIRGDRRYVELDSDGRVGAHGPDPELDYLKDRYSREFASAIGITLAALSSEERSLLSLYFLDGLTLAAIASVFKVHESTVARWIARARTRVLDETRNLLRERLEVDTAELDSLMALVRSRIDLRISQHLRATRRPT